MNYLFKPTSFLAGALLTASSFLNAGTVADPVATTPVGYTTTSVPAGSAVISATFVNSDSYVGQVVSVSGAQITFAASSFTAGDFDEGDFPAYYVEITEDGHPYEGQLFDILSNTSDTVTVAGVPDLTVFSLVTSDSVVIRKHFTLSQLFESPSVALGSFVEAAKFFNSDTTDSVYTWTGSIWSSDFGTTDEGNRHIYPGEGILLSSSVARDLVISGTVKVTPTRLPILASNSILVLVGSTSPSDTTLGELGFANSLDDFTGTVKFFNNDGALSSGEVYTDWGSFMTNDFGTTDSSDVVVPAGQPLLVSNGSNKTISLPAPYTP